MPAFSGIPQTFSNGIDIYLVGVLLPRESPGPISFAFTAMSSVSACSPAAPARNAAMTTISLLDKSATDLFPGGLRRFCGVIHSRCHQIRSPSSDTGPILVTCVGRKIVTRWTRPAVTPLGYWGGSPCAETLRPLYRPRSLAGQVLIHIGHCGFDNGGGLALDDIGRPSPRLSTVPL